MSFYVYQSILVSSIHMTHTSNKLFLEHMQQLRVVPVVRGVGDRVQLYDGAGPRRGLLRDDLDAVVQRHAALFYCRVR